MIESIIKFLSYKESVMSVNCVCSIWFYQPELPNKVKKLKKKKKDI